MHVNEPGVLVQVDANAPDCEWFDASQPAVPSAHSSISAHAVSLCQPAS